VHHLEGKFIMLVTAVVMENIYLGAVNIQQMRLDCIAKKVRN